MSQAGEQLKAMVCFEGGFGLQVGTFTTVYAA
jgi:hypothetical protein